MEKETRYIAIGNQKGGVGKSALTTLVASYLHYVLDKNVVVIDCDYPQFSIFRMRESDIETLGKNQELQVALERQFDATQKKAYKVAYSLSENALKEAETIIENSPNNIDVILFDLPGTVNSEGILNLMINLDYIFVPIIADKRVLQSSLAFVMSVNEYIKNSGGSTNLKEVYMFWNKIDKRENTELYDAFNELLKEEEISLLDTVVPDTKRYNKELSENRNLIFRSTLFPPDKQLLKNSSLDELAEEIVKIINL